MADGELLDSGDVNSESQSDEVFANGDEDSNKDNNSFLHPDYGCLANQVMPRKSSLIKDTSRRNRRKKTVSFSSMPGERTVVNAPDCLYYMQNGSELIKVRSNGRQYHRLFTLDADLKEIRWHPSSKKPNKAKLPLDQIKEVRLGRNTDVLRNKEIECCYQDACVFSIIFGDNFESLDLVANSADEANIWATGLACLITGKFKGAVNPDGILTERQQLRDKWLQEVFESADVDRTGVLDEFEVVRLMKKLNNSLATIKIQQKLKELSISSNEKKKRLSSAEFISLFKEISTRPEIYFLLVRYASASDYMTTDELLLFLEAEQGMSGVTTDKCLEIINEFEPSAEGRHLGQLGIDGFTGYLLSEECDIFDALHLEVCQDMTHPLSHYFIASSHNTYLLKDQLKGPSSIEGYIRALKKGCRYIKLDCWDGPNDEPIIYHGHTLTSKISFKAAMDAIKEYAFVASDYPVIMNLENHCSIKQQQLMSDIIKDVLGDKLCTDRVDENLQYLPSPEFLKQKILVKCKKLNNFIVVGNEDEDDCVTEEDEVGETEQQRKTNKREGSLKKYKLARELSDLVKHCRSVRFQDFQTAHQQGKCFDLMSFSESSALRLANVYPEEFVGHNKRFLSRVYPNGMRVDSSNFNPQDLWNCGCQLVALNYQTCGLMMDLNDGRFMQNGLCGYVLKPAVMREEIAFFSANTRDIIPGVSPQILHVKIISGQQLPKPKASGAKGNTVDPYITVEIFGIPADCVEERTKTVQNSANPIFDESFEFQINLPELALVRFAVLDDDFIGDEFIGQYTIPFECMQPGYRHIRLRSNTGETIANCTLFVHLAITNKKGGGKATRRTSLLRKKKSQEDYLSMKMLGIKAADDTFKVASQPLRDAIDMGDKVQLALITLKESCGLAPISNIKQTIRALLTKIQALSENITLSVILKDNFPVIEVQGILPDVLKKALTSFETFVDECKNLISKADDVCEKLITARSNGMDFHDDLQNLASQQGLKGKKLNKAVENFAWNVRVLKGQADLMRQAKLKCLEHMKQIQDTATFLGLTQRRDNGENVKRVSSVGSITSASTPLSESPTNGHHPLASTSSVGSSDAIVHDVDSRDENTTRDCGRYDSDQS